MCGIVLFIFSLTKFHQISTCKKKDFNLLQRIVDVKKSLDSPNFIKKKKVPVSSQEYRRILVSFLLSYLVCNPIWLNYFLYDRHLGYITKSFKNTSVKVLQGFRV